MSDTKVRFPENTSTADYSTDEYSTADSWGPQTDIGAGFCFDCDKPVSIEYYKRWFSPEEPPRTCQVCGGHDVEFMSRVAKRLWRKLEFAWHLADDLVEHVEIWKELGV